VFTLNLKLIILFIYAHYPLQEIQDDNMIDVLNQICYRSFYEMCYLINYTLITNFIHIYTIYTI